MRYASLFRVSAVLLLCMLMHAQAKAGVVITGTRLVYPASQKEVTVKLNNNGARPVLVQSWVDSGDIQSSPTSSKSPFVLSPPVSRIDPSKGQSLRLVFTGAALPTNRESVFWLNVLEIPPKAEGPTDLNMLQMAFRSRIKIFIAPTVCQVIPTRRCSRCNGKSCRRTRDLPCRHSIRARSTCPRSNWP